MTDEIDSKARECLSAMVDNEAFELELFRTAKALSEDEALRDTWHRYHLVSSVMRKKITVVTSDLSSQIASAIDLEAELSVSPVESSDYPVNSSGNVVVAAKEASNDNSGASASNRGFQKFAVAASVALAVVIGVQQLQPGSGDASLNVTDSVANVTNVANITTAEDNALDADRPAVTGPQFQLPSGYVLPRVNLQTVSTSTLQPVRSGLDVGHGGRNIGDAETDQQIQNYLNHMLLRYTEQSVLRNTPRPE